MELPNEVWVSIFSYLTMSDRRMIRLVSQRFREIVDVMLKHMKNCILKISDKNIADIKSLVQQLSPNVGSLSFENLKLKNISQIEELRFIMQNVGHRIHFLSMENSRVFDALVGNVVNLKALQLNFDDALLDANCNHFSLADFDNLEHLDFIENGVMPHETNTLLLQLTEPAASFTIKHFKLVFSKETEAKLLRVLVLHAHSLEYLHIHFSDNPRSLEPWSKIFSLMSNLRSLHLTGSCSGDWLASVFDSLPKSVQLDHLELSGLHQLDDTILELIVEKWRQSLQVMELMFCNITDLGAIALGKLKKLRVLNLSQCDAITNRGLLTGIAAKPNYTMEELYISDVWKLDEVGLRLTVSRLPNLRILNLNNLPRTVTNASLADIFHHQIKIRKLYLEDNAKITDDGLIGGADEYAFTIRRLRGLEVLSLRNCRNLSNRTLTEALHFPELRSLQLDYCTRITSVGIANMVNNCPSIENLNISSCVMLDDNAIIAIGKGLKRLNKLNISHCTRLTDKAFHFIANNCHSLEYLTICGLGICDNHELRAKLKSKLKELIC